MTAPRPSGFARPSRARGVASLVAVAIALAAPFAAAQAAPKKPKKGTKPAVVEAPAPTPVPEPPPPPPEPTPEPAPAATEPAPTTDAAVDTTTSTDEKITDVYEKPGTKYYFVGLRYRGTIIPKAILNLFVNEGASVYSSSIGVEFDLRKDGFSLIPAVSYTEYGTGDVLFQEKNKSNDAFNYSVVNSSLKALYFTADLLWSVNISKVLDFEYGAGFGLGVIFGDLSNNWVHEDPNGPLTSSASPPKHYSPCQTINDGFGCSPSNHTNPDPAKVGGYTESSWVNGGSKPNVFPHLALPELGVRIKPIKQLETRVMVGFSLTGFFFGINGAYGLEKTAEKK